MLNMIKKLSGLSAIYLICNTVHAMQALEEHHLSNISGGDGITISFNTDVTIDRVIWIDNDGMQPINGNNFGIVTPERGLFIAGDVNNPVRITGGQTRIKIDADGGASGSDNSTVNIEIELPDNLSIETGNIYIAGRDTPQTIKNQTQLMSNMLVSLHGLKMNIQLGNSPQGDLAKIYGTVNDGIRVQNIGIMNSDGSNVMSMDEFKVSDYGNASLFTFNGTGVNIVPQGIVITPSSGKKLDVSMSNLKLGQSNTISMGEMFISGMEIGNNIVTISGH